MMHPVIDRIAQHHSSCRIRHDCPRSKEVPGFPKMRIGGAGGNRLRISDGFVDCRACEIAVPRQMSAMSHRERSRRCFTATSRPVDVSEEFVEHAVKSIRRSEMDPVTGAVNRCVREPIALPVDRGRCVER